MTVAIGVDLGTTNTVVAAVIDGVAVTLEDDHGRRLLPSVVSLHPSSTVLVGEAARERRLIDPENTIFSVKPLLGRSWTSDEVKAAASRLPFRLTEGAKNSTMVIAREVEYALPEISAFVLRRAKAIAEAALGQKVERAVVTVPANFNELQRASTKVAGKLAGLEVIRILNEPTAAALAYGQSISRSEKIAVYDLGGGTFDVTLLDLSRSVFEVLATGGDTALGGDDVNALIAERMALAVLERVRVDLRADPAGIARLAFFADEVKKELSSAPRAEVELTGIGYGDGGRPLAMPFAMTREELERLAAPLVERTISVAEQTIELTGLSPGDFARAILVGGSTRMPLVARMVERLFGRPPHLSVNPDEVVALGAAIQAHALSPSKGAVAASGGGGAAPAPLPDFFTFQKAPAVISFSEESLSPSPLPRPPSPPRAAPTADRADPGRGARAGSAPSLAREERPSDGNKHLLESEVFRELELSGAPDPARLARGSAIATSASPPLLIDVTPLSLGVETAGGYTDVLIPANSPVPCDKTRTFLTASDDQTTVSIRVAQGESPRFADNTRLGDLELTALRGARRGEVKVAVTFELDADGILNVTARDQDTGREATATMRLLGTSTDAEDMSAMAARQARHDVV